MAVIPIGARLDDGKFINEFRARLDAGEADAGHAIHLERQDQAMPVDRAVLVEIVDDGESCGLPFLQPDERRSEEHTSELQSLMRISYAVFCLKKKIKNKCSQHSHLQPQHTSKRNTQE